MCLVIVRSNSIRIVRLKIFLPLTLNIINKVSMRAAGALVLSTKIIIAFFVNSFCNSLFY